MKHSTRLAALMASLAVLAFLPGAQVCGQSHHHGGSHSSSSHSSSYSHGSSHGGPRGGSYSSSHSHSGSTYSTHSSSSGSSSHQHSSASGGGQYRRSSGSVSSQQQRPSASSSSSHQHRPSGGSVSSNRPSSGSYTRPSGGSVSSNRPSSSSYTRPSGGSVSGSHSGSHSGHHSGRPDAGDISSRASRVPDTGSGSHHSGDFNRERRPDVSHGTPDRRPDVNRSAPDHRPGDAGHVGHNSGARRPGSFNDGVYRSRPSGGSVSHNRPAPGRTYADGVYGHGSPSRVHMHPNPGARRPAARPAPRELRGTPMHFSHRGHHHYGHYIPTPPPRYTLRHYWGRDYYYYNDIWYRYYAGRYWVCRPPWGYVFTPLADAVYTACTFAYYFDRLHYYDAISDNASTIVAQNETIAANNAVIASQNETIARNAALAQASGDLAKSLGLVQSYASADTEYFYNDGVFYVKAADGQYTVIVPPAGALVESLPDDYEIIELGGESYYKVDDTVYRTAVVDGKACFEVLGQLMK